MKIYTDPFLEKVKDMVNKNKDELVVVTHSGRFHAHEVMAVALMEADVVIRTRSKDIINFVAGCPSGRVIDIGGVAEGNILDHHQHKGYKGLPSMYFIDSPLSIDQREILESVAMQDCGEVALDYVSAKIASFNPSWDESGSNVAVSTFFHMAVQYAQVVLKNPSIFIAQTLRDSKRKQGNSLAKKAVKKAIDEESNGIITLDRFCPWIDTVVTHNRTKNNVIFFGVYPEIGETGNWILRAVPHKDEPMTNLYDILVNENDEKLTFCHPNKFLAGFRTKQAAVRCGEKSIAMGVGNVN